MEFEFRGLGEAVLINTLKSRDFFIPQGVGGDKRHVYMIVDVPVPFGGSDGHHEKLYALNLSRNEVIHYCRKDATIRVLPLNVTRAMELAFR